MCVCEHVGKVLETYKKQNEQKKTTRADSLLVRYTNLQNEQNLPRAEISITKEDLGSSMTRLMPGKHAPRRQVYSVNVYRFVSLEPVQLRGSLSFRARACAVGVLLRSPMGKRKSNEGASSKVKKIKDDPTQKTLESMTPCIQTFNTWMYLVFKRVQFFISCVFDAVTRNIMIFCCLLTWVVGVGRGFACDSGRKSLMNMVPT